MTKINRFPWRRGAAAFSFAILGLGVSACDSNRDLSAQEPVGPRPGPAREPDLQRDESVFGPGGFSINSIRDGSLFGGGEERKGTIPVNKFLWQASLDTLSFLPLASTDPFTGVIATDWGATPEAPGERFKVTAYLVDTELTASSLRVAVFREALNENNVWVPATVSADTARQLEDAILTRARQLRIADAEGSNTG